MLDERKTPAVVQPFDARKPDPRGDLLVGRNDPVIEKRLFGFFRNVQTRRKVHVDPGGQQSLRNGLKLLPRAHRVILMSERLRA